jgi:hypothetical protein
MEKSKEEIREEKTKISSDEDYSRRNRMKTE